MACSNSNILFAIIIIIILGLIIYYLNKNNNQIDHFDTSNMTNAVNSIKANVSNAIRADNQVLTPRNGSVASPRQSILKNGAGAVSGNTVARAPRTRQQNQIARYPHTSDCDEVFDRRSSQFSDSHDSNFFSPSDPMASDHAPFVGYGRKRQLNFDKTEFPFSDSDECDERNFTFKKKQFTKRTPEDIADLFDVDQMLPQENEDWFDTLHLQDAKRIKGTHFIHPKVHMGVNTISGSMRNGTHDIRGDVPNPQIKVSIWGQSTINPDTNSKGLCN